MWHCDLIFLIWPILEVRTEILQKICLLFGKIASEMNRGPKYVRYFLSFPQKYPNSDNLVCLSFYIPVKLFCLNKLFWLISKFRKFSAFILKYPKHFLITRREFSYWRLKQFRKIKYYCSLITKIAHFKYFQ